MRQVRYSVAMSVNAFIAGPAGECDWIVMDPAVDFETFYKSFDAVLIGRRTFEIILRSGMGFRMPGMRTYVFSRTLHAKDHPGVTVLSEAEPAVAALREEGTGKDIWLMGGGMLFRSLLEAGLVDILEVDIVPVLLGQGIPLLLLPSLPNTFRLQLLHSEIHPSGIVSLRYAVNRDPTGQETQ